MIILGCHLTIIEQRKDSFCFVAPRKAFRASTSLSSGVGELLPGEKNIGDQLADGATT